MTSGANFEIYASRLSGTSINTKLKCTIALELCESFEYFQPQDTSRFMNILWPTIRDFLLKSPPVFTSNSMDQKLRSTLIDTIRRIPLSENLRDHAPELASTFLELVKIENEDNGVMCLKIIYDLHRMYYVKLESFSQAFLELALDIYGKADEIAKHTRDLPDGHGSGLSTATPGVAAMMSPGPMSPGQDGQEAPKKSLLPATKSFKVITEIPIIIVSIFQALKEGTAQYAQKLLPLVIQMLEIHPENQQKGPTTVPGQTGGDINGHISLGILDLTTAQSKTLSFLAFLVRSFTQLAISHKDKIAKLVVDMLHSCPIGAIAIRKEILVACRHIISTDLRSAFLPHFERLLDPKILHEPANSNHKMIKVYTISMLVDLIHNIRNDLSLEQLGKVIDFFAGCMNDASLTPTIHTMCVKILFYVVDSVSKIQDKASGRILLLSILDCYTRALSMVAARVQCIRKLTGGMETSTLWRFETDDHIHISTLEPQDPIKECKTLLQTVISGCQATLSRLKMFQSFLFDHTNTTNLKAPGGEGSVSDIDNFELDLITALFCEGLRAFRIMKTVNQKDNKALSGGNQKYDAKDDDTSKSEESREAQIRTLNREEKQLIEQFANLFVPLHPAIFQELFSTQIGHLFDEMIENAAVISAAQVFLASVTTSPGFISIMLDHLCQNLSDLGSEDEVVTTTMLHLFKIAFLALTFFPEENEPVLKLYVQAIINSALEEAATAQQPQNYYMLLRSLFRCIGGGRYETLYAEVFPLLQTLLETFNASLKIESKPTPQQELLIDICLTVPVRLSALLPYLPLLMRPLVAALHAGPDLISQGLRTLELCVDNLTRDFLDPILLPFMNSIMESLWNLLTPNENASAHSRTAARILGKLGGRNRSLLDIKPNLDSECAFPDLLESGNASSVKLRFHDINDYIQMPLRGGIESAVATIKNHYPPWLASHLYNNALKFIKITLLTTIKNNMSPKTSEFLSDESNTKTEALGRTFVDVFDKLETRQMLASLISPSTSQGQGESPSNKGMCKNSLNESEANGSSMQIEETVEGFGESRSESIHRKLSLESTSSVETFDLLQALVIACTREHVKDEALVLLDKIIRLAVVEHFSTCIEAAKENSLHQIAVPSISSTCQMSLAKDSEYTPSLLLIPVIALALSSNEKQVSSVGQHFISVFTKTVRAILGPDEDRIYRVPFFHLLFSQLCQACYSPKGSMKIGACAGVLFMITELNLGKDWVEVHEIEAIKALLFVLKASTPEKIKQIGSNKPLDAILAIIKLCHSTESIIAAQKASFENDKQDGMDIEESNLPTDKKLNEEAKSEAPASTQDDKKSPQKESSENGVETPKDQGATVSSASNDKAKTNEKAENEAATKANNGPQFDVAKDKPLYILLSIFAKELSNPNSLIRDAVKSSIEFLTKTTKQTAIVLLTPYRERLLRSIFAKPLRALPHSMQIGSIDAITYCLNLSPDFIEINEEMMRLLSEALALTDAEDQALVNNPTQVRASLPSLINLRYVCIKMLTSAIARAEFMQPRHATIRSRIISVFFKFLYSKSPKVVSAANDGLQKVLVQQQKLPKDLLQAGLRPILLNLSDHKHLNVVSLEGLARLMKLLTNYFKVEVGRKLLDHLRQLADAAKLRQAATKTIKDIQDIKVFVAIFNVFHLLPSSASVLMEELVTAVLQLEAYLIRRQSSPFRPPLFLFLNKYPTETINYFFERIKQPSYSRLFIHALSDKSCDKLRSTLVEQGSKIVDLLKPVKQENESSDDKSAAFHPTLEQVHGCLIVQALNNHIPNLLDINKDINDTLMSDIWRKYIQSPIAPIHQARFNQVAILKSVLATIISGTSGSKKWALRIFSIAEALDCRLGVLDSGQIEYYLCSKVLHSANMHQRRSIIALFFEHFDQNVYDPKASVLRRVVIPLIAYGICPIETGKYPDVLAPCDSIPLCRTGETDARASQFLSGPLLNLVQSNIWAPLSVPESNKPGVDDYLCLQCISLSFALLRKAPNVISDTRKDLIRFGWTCIRHEDPIVKHAAYVLLAQFISTFETPSKIVVQVLVHLLRAYQPEYRPMVRQALEILLPSLPSRVQSPANPTESPMWIKLINRILFENGHTVGNITHIYQLIIKRSDMFYPYRDQFTPKLINSLTKLCLTQAATLETRNLAFDIIEMLLKWDKRCVLESVPPSQRESATLVQLRANITNPVVTEQKREAIVGILLRILCMAYDFVAKSGTAEKLNGLLVKYLDQDVWPPIYLRLTFFERALHNVEIKLEKYPFFEHILKSLEYLSENMREAWFVENFATLASIVLRFLKTEKLEIQQFLANLLEKLYSAMSKNENLYNAHTSANFRQHIQTHIFENLQSGTGLFGILLILNTIGKYQGEQFYDYIPLLVKLLQKNTRDFVAQSQSNSETQVKNRDIVDLIHKDMTASDIQGDDQQRILLLSILILRKHLMQLGDQRRGFLATIIQLVERTKNPFVLAAVLGIVRMWVLNSKDSFPTTKEKATLMSAMMCLTTNPEANPGWDPLPPTSELQPRENSTNVSPQELLSREYLTLVSEIYSQDCFSRTELTMRLENAFLLGLKCWDHDLRNKFFAIFDENLPRSLTFRLNYFFKTQNWESLSDSFWLQQCIPLLLGSLRTDVPIYTSYKGSSHDLINKPESTSSTDQKSAMEVESSSTEMDNICTTLKSLATDFSSLWVEHLITPLTQLLVMDKKLAYQMWIQWFPQWWKHFGTDSQHDIATNLIYLLAKPYHSAQTAERPNIVQAFLEAIAACDPIPRLPPQLLRYLGQTYGVWHATIALLEENVLKGIEVEACTFDHSMGVETGAFNALSDLYTSLGEESYNLGLWKRHCQYFETHVALSYEQLGDWQSAQNMYEKAQSKARTGVLPFSETEYSLWENRWIESTKRLQSWDMLEDLGKQEALPELELEAAWRLWDWPTASTAISLLLSSCSTEFSSGTRYMIYNAYLKLAESVGDKSKATEFQSICESGIHAALKQWHDLPSVGTQAHLEILHQFQLFTELQDANSIYSSLASTKLDNLETRSEDLKSVMLTWRERLPSNNDPIYIWSDLVAWRQHIFKAINEVYIPFIQKINPSGSGSGAQDGTNGASGGGNTTFAYRGYHEIAWIINRFAHVARKHKLFDVCVSSLTRIYTLPNIEIQEAFLKLREQAKCYYDRPDELQNGLDVINNTNLAYFSAAQKAEFYTLKGRFLAKLGMPNEANASYAQGIQVDLRSAKSWASWARYNDERFRVNPSEISSATNAVSCYLQASSISKNAKTRRYHARILWLLSQDDDSSNVARAFEDFKGDISIWYWVSFIPQLLLALNEGYAKQAMQILQKIAKMCPQALHYPLRTARDEALLMIKQQQLASANSGSGPDPSTPETPSVPTPQQQPATPAALLSIKVDELMAKLKTAYPLLSLSIETMTDQIVQRIKPTPLQDMYRLICVLTNDALQNLHSRVSSNSKDVKLLDTMMLNIRRVIATIKVESLKELIESDFSNLDSMDLKTYTLLLQKWRIRLRQIINSQPSRPPLSRYSMYLVDFEYERFEDIDLPGQYLILRDYSEDLVRIDRFLPEVCLVDDGSTVSPRISILGRNGLTYSFTVQTPSSRHSRREEKVIQFFRMLDHESARERNILEQRPMAFNFPSIVPLSHHIRLIQSDPTNFAFQDVFTKYCKEFSPNSDSAISYYIETMPKLIAELPSIEDAQIVLFDAICERYVPKHLLLNAIAGLMPSQFDFWLYRRQFTFQMALTAFQSFLISSNQRSPAKLFLSRKTGNIWPSDMLPAYNNNNGSIIHNSDPVPFRMTPNMQALASEIGLEGIVPFALYDATSKILKPELFLRDIAEPFIKDELLSLYIMSSTTSNGIITSPSKDIVEVNVRQMLKKVTLLGTALPMDKVLESGELPLQQSLNLITQATASLNLSKMDFTWMPWL
ncbi:transcription-associated protein 1 [Mycoemilia scoparia]|uniref:Transcription-associated protein 1 n=1 Tax=Mycoemilia scoparia TaxID=417184 RepID=A0A9W8A9B2_9FUNG|nr:transcription-associated protein 1 [Mycoemilia scoparia]